MAMENLYWAALTTINGLGSARMRRLKEVFGDIKSIWSASLDDLLLSKVAPRTVMEELVQMRDSDCVERLAQQLSKYQINICRQEDEFYPEMLQDIYNPPFLLFYQGRMQKQEHCIAIVGSRHCTAYGKQVAQWLGEELTQQDFTIVSGAAKGIDTNAHNGALKIGRTIAVVGTGLDIIYPSSNAKLMSDILDNDGAIISQFPPGTQPLPGNFPARNQIIAGLSKGTIVVEAAAKSGSLITAEFSLAQGRDVFAIPGNIYATTSIGCHKLIQDGAKLVYRIEDILEEYGLDDSTPMEVSATTMQSLHDTIDGAANSIASTSKQIASLSADEQLICKTLEYGKAISTDELICRLRGQVSNISFILLQLKLQGLIIEGPINHFRLNV